MASISIIVVAHPILKVIVDVIDPKDGLFITRSVPAVGVAVTVKT